MFFFKKKFTSLTFVNRIAAKQDKCPHWQSSKFTKFKIQNNFFAQNLWTNDLQPKQKTHNFPLHFLIIYLIKYHKITKYQ